MKMKLTPLMNLYTDEKWLPIKDYEGLYDVSDYGNIRSYARGKNRGGILKAIINNEGYPTVTLCKNGIKDKVLIHIKVAEAHIPNPHNYPVVNHLKGIKVDNRITQLEWCTIAHNVQHTYDIGNFKQKCGEQHHLAKHSNDFILKLYNDIGTDKEISEKYNLSRRYVNAVKNGKIWSTVTNKT